MNPSRIGFSLIPYLSLAAVLYFHGAEASAGEESKVKVGERAPNFILPTQTGERFELAQLLGKQPIVLYFYPKDDTPGCTKQACSFRDEYQAFVDVGASVIGVSSDAVRSHREFIAKYRLPFTLLSDESGQVRARYGASTVFGILPGRVTYVIDRQGVVQHIFSSQFRPTAHVDEALRVLQALEKNDARDKENASRRVKE